MQQVRTPHHDQLMPDVELRIGGKVRGPAVAHLANELEEVVRLRPEHLILDLGSCTELVRAAARCIVDAQAALAPSGGRLLIRDASPALVEGLVREGLRDGAELSVAGGAVVELERVAR